MSCNDNKMAAPPQKVGTTLCIGYGNTLRTDDAAGPTVASRLGAQLNGVAACECIVAQQLTPELADEVSQAERVIFVDASVEFAPGKVRIRRAGAITAATPGVGHHASPEMILTLAKAVYGREPAAWVIGIGVGSLAVGERLSWPVAGAVFRLVRHLAYHVNQWSSTHGWQDGR